MLYMHMNKKDFFNKSSKTRSVLVDKSETSSDEEDAPPQKKIRRSLPPRKARFNPRPVMETCESESDDEADADTEFPDADYEDEDEQKAHSQELKEKLLKMNLKNKKGSSQSYLVGTVRKRKQGGELLALELLGTLKEYNW